MAKRVRALTSKGREKMRKRVEMLEFAHALHRSTVRASKAYKKRLRVLRQRDAALKAMRNAEAVGTVMDHGLFTTPLAHVALSMAIGCFMSVQGIEIRVEAVDEET